jgi:hypothetical protein
MRVNLEFAENGRIARLIHPNGLTIACFLVFGPFERNAKSVAKGFDDVFNAEVRGIGDNQYIDTDKCEVKTRLH